MLSHYQLVEMIGEGGMGVVWKAEDTVLNRTVAVKVLPADLALDEERRRMFLDEARLAASVAHGNIVQVHELGREGDLDFIVMEYVEGQPLSKLLNGRPLPPDKVAEWGLQVAQGLARAHRKGLIHRDLKPANILVTPEGELKIVDFGLATLFSQPGSRTGSVVSTLTESLPGETATRIAGTLPYMSPEQVRGEKLDARSDIFSFGTVLYEMTTGQRPFTGPKPAAIAQEILKCQPQPVHELVVKVPLVLHQVIEKALARRPEDRYQHMDDVAVDLNRLRKDLESGSSPSYEDLRQIAAPLRPRWVAILATGLAGVVVASGIWVLVSRNQPPRPAVATEGNSLAIFVFENLHDPADPQRLGQIFQELMIADLSALEPLKVLSSQRLYDIEEQLDRGAGRAGRNITTSVASQAGARRMLIGSLGQIADRWIVTCQLVEVQSGTVIESKRLDGTDVYSMVDRLSDELRGDLALRMPAEFAGKSIGEKTSTSLEAWRHYLDGMDQLNKNRYAEAVQEFAKAVEIDPNFRQAYYKLAVAAERIPRRRREGRPLHRARVAARKDGPTRPVPDRGGGPENTSCVCSRSGPMPSVTRHSPG
jgi:serine/threonine protein kinase